MICPGKVRSLPSLDSSGAEFRTAVRGGEASMNRDAAVAAVRFQAASAVTRLRRDVLRRRSRARLANLSGAKVQLGCGDLPFAGWTNVDLGRGADLRMDLRGGFPAPARSVQLIYSEHFFEHMPLPAAQTLLRDCAHALTADGVFRAAMPDLRYLVERYLSPDWREQAWLSWPDFRYIDTPVRMLNEAMRNWDHMYLYDAEELRLRLLEAGFTWTRRVERDTSEVAELRDRESRDDSLLIMEAGVS